MSKLSVCVKNWSLPFKNQWQQLYLCSNFNEGHGHCMLCQDEEIYSYKGEAGKVAVNLLACDFEAENPNQKWVTDVTEFSLFGQKLYLPPILDLCSRDIVSHTISDRPELSMVTEMLNKAFAKIPKGTQLILRADEGWKYQHKQYKGCLPKKEFGKA